MSSADEAGTPSPFFSAQLERLRREVGRAPVLDLACGRGRHALAAAAVGLRVVAIDRNAEFLATLGDLAGERGCALDRVRADLEAQATIPVEPGSCGAILVFRFLYRPLCAEIERALAPGGLLLYETFTRDQPSLGWGPRNPAFLLDAGELPYLFSGLEPLSFEEGLRDAVRSEHCASLLARKTLN